MKKLFFIATFIFVTSTSSSQVWIDQGAEWTYHFIYYGVPHTIWGHDRIFYSSDTIILGKTCQVLETHHYEWYQAYYMPSPVGGLYILPNRYTYMSGDTVYYWNDNKFDILYNFNAIVGNNWDVGVDTNTTTNCSKSIQHVTQTGTDTINSGLEDWLYIEHDSLASVSLQGKAYKRFGSENYLFPVPFFCQSNTTWWPFELRCFSDNSFSLYNPSNYGCYSTVSVGELNKNNLIVYPNPAKDKITFMTSGLKHDITIQVYNLMGVIVLKEISFVTGNEDYTLNIEDLPTGIYLISVTDSKNIYTAKILVE